jgi:hypothetical protein
MTATPFRVAAVALPAIAVLTVALFLAAPTAQPDPQLSVTGPDDGVLLGADDLNPAHFLASVDRAGALDDVVLELDGVDVTAEAARDERSLRWDLDGVEDGSYTFTASLDEQRDSRTFTVDTTPPALSVEAPEGPLIGDTPMEITGTVDDPEAEVRVGDVEAEVDGDRFSAALEAGTEGPITVTATDMAGNSTSEEVAAELAWVPSRVEVDEIRAVHASFYGWVTGSKKDPVMDMIEAGLINSVQLDLKDESGMVGYGSEVPLALEAGAVANIFDLEETIAELHELGVHVSGRIVAFADPVLSRYSWDNDARDRVIQTAGGEFYTGRYAGFINFANPEVRQYNIDIAVEAARAGIDDILWDYVRRPDGAVEQFTFPGLPDDVSPEESIADFVAEADEAIAPYGVGHGASLYGIAVDRPRQIGQDVDLMADHLDYVAPMLYPSHWGPGEYGVANPNQQPYDIIHRSMEAWVEKVDGTRARVVPWLQDFSMGHRYGPQEVRAQIDASADHGVHEWMLWNAGMNFTPDALPSAPAGDNGS